MQNFYNDISSTEFAKLEAKSIDNAYNKVPDNTYLRLHVSGDSKTITGTKLLSKAASRWLNKGGKGVWTYTHAWRNINRKHWGKISVLASIDSINDANLAKSLNYVPALVVSEFASKKAFKISGSDIKWIPCPAQTNDNVSCSSCKLCFSEQKLKQINARNSICSSWYSKKYNKKTTQNNTIITFFK